MKAVLKLKVGSYSINNAYYKRNKQYNQNARKYRKKFIQELNSQANIATLRDLKKRFNRKKHYLSIKFNFFYPKDILLTKEGHLSRRAKDIDNCLKLPIDFLCAPKYMTDSKYLDDMDMEKIVNLGIDDQYIGEIAAIKRPSLDSTNYLVIDIEIKSLNNLCLSQDDF